MVTLLVAALAIWFFSSLIDHFWFIQQIPSDYADAQWSGEWQSDRVSIVSGRLVAILPEPIPRDEEFDVDAIVYYRIWCPYRSGSVVPMKMVGFLPSEDSSARGGNTDTPVVIPATFSFKGGDGPSEQTIDYVATTDEDATIFVGGYRSSGPSDMGRFVLEKH